MGTHKIFDIINAMSLKGKVKMGELTVESRKLKVETWWAVGGNYNQDKLNSCRPEIPNN